MDEIATPENRTAVDTGEQKDGDGTSVEEARAGVTDAAKAEGGALLHLRCFGEFVVPSGDRAISVSGDEGASYKAWEILAFLAAQPAGAVLKEKLITAIWPDIEPGRAANRMRVAMAWLRALLARQVLGVSSEVVHCERDGTYRVDTKLVWSDAQAYLDPKYPEDDAHLDQPVLETVALFNEIRSELEAQVTQVRSGRRQVIGQVSSQGS